MCMELNYYALWKLMADLIRELKRRGESIPPQVMDDLRSAKTMLEIAKIDRSNVEVTMRIEEYLNNLESYLLPLAREKLGEEHIDKLMKDIAEAQRNMSTPKKKEERRFPVGAPRDKHWIRIKPTEEMPLNAIREVCGETGLKHDLQEDGYVLIYGEKEQIKEFVKRTARRLLKEDSSAK